MSGRIDEFDELGCGVLAINTDDVETHTRWLSTSTGEGGLGQIRFPLGSDADGSVCRQYGVYLERRNLALRGLFIIDPNGVLQYQSVHNLSVGRSTDEILRVLDALQSGGLCPAERRVGDPTVDLLASLGPNRVIGDYRIESELGSGAFGTVYRARDQILDRTVALKVLRTDEETRTESLLAEARAAAALNHPNVCAVHTIDTTQGAGMIVMEFVDGETLAHRLKTESIPSGRSADWLRQIAAGMAAAHAAGVIHGDLKPANLIISADETIKIMDFGLARRVATGDWQAETLPSDISQSQGLSGTPSYMAPEITRGETPSPASDVFALGLIAYEMLTGHAAVSSDNLLAALRSIQELDAERLASELPQQFRAITLGCLAADPARRVAMPEIAAQLSK